MLGRGREAAEALREVADEVESEAGLAAVEEALFDLRLELGKGGRALSLLPRLASTLGVLGALYQLLWLHAGDHGIAGLMAGLPEQLASERALLSVAIGFGTWLPGGLAARWLGTKSRSLYAGAVEKVEEAGARLERGAASRWIRPSGRC